MAERALVFVEAGQLLECSRAPAMELSQSYQTPAGSYIRVRPDARAARIKSAGAIRRSCDRLTL